MSLSEVTGRCFQSGISVQKWARMCHLLKEKSSLSAFEAQCELCNAVLDLFGLYPADLLLYSYLKYAMHNLGLISLPAFVATFLEASSSSNLHDTSTLSMLCRLIQEEHLSSGLPPDRSLIDPRNSSTTRVLEITHSGLSLLRVSYTLPPSPFHNLAYSVSQLVMLLLSCVNDMSSITTAQAMMHYAEVIETLQTLQLDAELRSVLESFAVSLSMILSDDTKMAQEAQLMQSLQLSLGKGDILGPNSPSDIVTCSLVLRHLVANKTTLYGSGSPMAIAILVTSFRWTSWTPRVFYTQLFLAAVSILAQNSTHRTSAFVWRSFVITRLTHLLSALEQLLSTESLADSDWRGATQGALLAIQNRTDLLEQCDAAGSRPSDDMSIDPSDIGRAAPFSLQPFFSSLVQYCAHRTNLIDNVTRSMFNAASEPVLKTLLTSDCQESGAVLDAHIDSRLISDGSNEETLIAFLRRALEDIPNHPQISRLVQKRVEVLTHQYDVEGLGILCKVLNSLDLAMDIITLHVKIDDMLIPILAFVDEFDCESVGDPQTALEYLGNVILLLQATLVKYQLATHTFTLGNRTLSTDYLLSTSSVYRMSSLGAEDVSVMATWSKALFDTNSEGIEDTILRTTKPKMLMKLTATLILQACNACADRRMENEVMRNGVSYFTGPLLNWTLVGGIKALLRDIFEKNFNTPVHLEVLQTLVESPSCPRAVLCLTGHGILGLISDPKASLVEREVSTSSFKTNTLRSIASKALGIPITEPSEKSLSLSSSHWLDQPRNAIRDFFAASRVGKAPAFDVGRCVAVLGPTRFLRLLWDELDIATQLGDLELSRRLASYVLLCPPAAAGVGAGRTPPLLPIFFGGVLHELLGRLDNRAPTEQTFGLELLVAVITSSLTGLLHLEWALRAMALDIQTERYTYQPSVTVARRLAADLKRSKSPSAAVILHRISSSPSFVANFPMMAA